MRENERNIPVRVAFRAYALTLRARAYGELILPIVGRQLNALQDLERAGIRLSDDQRGYIDGTDPATRAMKGLDLSLGELNSEETNRVSETFEDFGNLATSPSKSLPVIMRRGEIMHDAIKQAQDNARLAERQARTRLIGSLIGLLSAKIQRRD